MIIEMILSGFFFWFIITNNLAHDRIGHKTFSDLNLDAHRYVETGHKKGNVVIIIKK